MASSTANVIGALVLVGAAAALAALVIVGLLLLFKKRNRRIVLTTSAALAQLSQLNDRFYPTVAPLPPIGLSFLATATSKSQLDRFDIQSFLESCALQNEVWIANEISVRRQRMVSYVPYTFELSSIGERWLGRSADRRLSPHRYAQIEGAEFHSKVLPAPTPSASVVATVTYTSPAGRNSYSKAGRWDFEQLDFGLRSAQLNRDRRGTSAFLRQRERALMTPKTRTDVLRRDGARCRLCGASANQGATLHVDHIVPISHGGKTEMANLQVLCQSCNLGKSNRFVG